MNKLKICHIITSLEQGGVESWMFRLIESTSSTVEHHVISLKDVGVYGGRIRALGFKVHELNMGRGSVSKLLGFIRMILILKHNMPNCIQCWMYHANLLGGIAGYILGVKKIFWGIFATSLEDKITPFSTLLVDRISAIFSRFIPIKIIVCSKEAVNPHIENGYKDIFINIPLGYDEKLIQFSSDARAKYRKQWAALENDFLIGCIARWDPYKDHNNLMLALDYLLGSKNTSLLEGIKVVLIGPNMTYENPKLKQLIDSSKNCADRVILAGRVEDIPGAASSLDLHVLPSKSELFPNVVAETMLVGIPNVVTKVGGCQAIIDIYGWAIPPSNHILLANAIYAALIESRDSEAWTKRKNNCRNQIVNNYSINKISSKYLSVWMQ